MRRCRLGGCAVISFSMFQGLVTGMMATAVAAVASESEVTELRLRAGRPLVVATASRRGVGRLPSGAPFVVKREDIDRVIAIASDYSVYAVNDQLVRGYMARGGIRIGVAGEGVAEGGNLLTMKHIAFLTIRIPHEVKGAADGVRGAVFGGGVKNTLVISPPYGGKTTLLRELARICSSGHDTLAIRAMAPEVIVTDELFRASEAAAVCDIVRSGVKVFASLHGDGVESALRSAAFACLKEVMEVYILLSPTPRVGTVRKVMTAQELAEATP